MVEQFDTDLFWWINSHHTPWLDVTLWTFSQKWFWALFILSVYLIVTIRRDRDSWLWVITGIALCFVLADQISNNAIKDVVMRLRPCHAMEGVRMYRTHPGGLYGFVSSHAANAFAIAMFLSLMYGGKQGEKKPVDRRYGSVVKNIGSGYKSQILPYILISWATIVGYSRPYLGKHYPGDVVGGALLGLGVGAGVYFVISRIRSQICSKSVE